MTSLSWWAYLGAFAGSLVLAFVLTPLALRGAVRVGLLDVPAGHKAHAAPVPYLGGLAIVVAFSIAVLVAALIGRPVDGMGELAVILALGVSLSVLGLMDDIRGLPVWLRLLVEAGAGVALYVWGVDVDLFPGDVVDAVITVAWVVGVTNAFNLLDNMDGLSAGIAGISAGSFSIIAALNGQFLVAALAAGVAGCALGFLRHNFHPARIFMGDAGSLFLGFLLAVIGIKLRFDAPTQVTFFVPVLVLGVAIFDSVLVTITRLLRGRSPFAAARDHVSHRLVAIGLPVPAAVSLIYGGQVALSWLALVMSRVDVGTGFLLMGFVLAVTIFLGVLLALVAVDEGAAPPRELRWAARRRERSRV